MKQFLINVSDLRGKKRLGGGIDKSSSCQASLSKDVQDLGLVQGVNVMA